MLKKIKAKSLLGILLAVGAGLTAFCTERENQKKDAKIEDMERRIASLEEGRSE